jgi:hypothetical protein
MPPRAMLASFGLCVILVPEAAHPGAWTLPQGKGQVGLMATWIEAAHSFDAAGGRVPTARVDKFELQGLIEYGISDALTLIAAPALQHVAIAAPVSAVRTGFGHSELGARHRLMRGDSWVLSAQFALRAPGIWEPINPAAIGHTDLQVDLRALLGVSTRLGPWPAFIDLQLAQRLRSGAPPHEMRLDASLGVTFVPNWVVLAQTFTVLAQGERLPAFPRYRYHKLQLSLVHDLNPAWSVQLGGFVSVAGRSALQETGLLAATWYRF